MPPHIVHNSSSLRSVSKALGKWWYYKIELEPGIFTPGTLSENNYSTPRHALSRIKVQGLRCLDVGTMEGLIPTLWAKNEARQVVATDGWSTCVDKVDIIKHFHGVSFDYHLIPPAANIYDYLRDVEFSSAFYNSPHREGYKEFDLINFSGVLYHVWSPLHWLASVRPLLREGGLIVVSTHLLDTDKPIMEFNTEGHLQREADTFWYISPAVFQYMLNMLGLKPIDAVMARYEVEGNASSVYASVVCRAVDSPIARPGDEWMDICFANSIELKAHRRAKSYSAPAYITYSGKTAEGEPEISLVTAVKTVMDSVPREFRRYNYMLRLDDLE